MKLLMEMLKWKRPGGDIATEMFAKIYLEPVFGKPDEYGNYITKVCNEDGSNPNLCFTAHYDTVHKDGGFQELLDDGLFVRSASQDCLGADCTTGIWLCLEMLKSGIPGYYVIHADEESGCIGSGSIVRDSASWLGDLDAVISFDRMGTDSVITHQCGLRTASDEFAKSFADAVNMPELKPDPYGVYTDSNEYRGIVPECTNISVGYYKQHTKDEHQDLIFARKLRDSLLSADWSKLVIARDPNVVEDYYDRPGGRYPYYDGDTPDLWAQQDLYDLIVSYPEEVAAWLYDSGVTDAELAQEAGIDKADFVSRYLERGVA